MKGGLTYSQTSQNGDGERDVLLESICQSAAVMNISAARTDSLERDNIKSGESNSLGN